MHNNILLRFAPSPTGLLHIGNIRIAVINYLQAKKLQGKFVLRIDDTDHERSRKHFADQIIADIEWLGLHYDHIAFQSQRTDIYERYFAILKENDMIYECFESTEELAAMRKKQTNEKKPPVYNRTSLSLTEHEKNTLRTKRTPYWRFKLSQKDITWHDLIHGNITINTSTISDPVIKKPNGEFTYTFASSCDDFDMKISHIIRGDDHITNSAAQIEMWNAFMALTSPHEQKMPQIQLAHMPLFSMSDGTSLSKREMSAATIQSLRENFIQPLAICNTMARIGTNMQQNIVSDMSALIEEFNINKISTGSIAFDMQSITQANKMLLTNLTCEQVQDITGQKKYSQQFWELIKDNISSLSDINTWYKILSERDYQYDSTDENYLRLMHECSQKHHTYDAWISELKNISQRRGKELFHEIRLALTGQEQGPKLEAMIKFLGWDEVQNRFAHALICHQNKNRGKNGTTTI